MAYSLMVISPHLDDAVLGCAGLLAAYPGARVVTLLAGVPGRPEISTEWDAACGFRSATEAVQARREEDGEALRQLGAAPIWLDFCDGQYRQLPSVETLAEAVLEQIDLWQPAEVAVPMGLHHSDHILVARACAAAILRRPRSVSRWIGYEDGLYRLLPGMVQRRVADLARAGIDSAPHFLSIAASGAKREAILCYASQLGALQKAGLDWKQETDAVERYWLLRPAMEAPEMFANGFSFPAAVTS